MAVAGLRQSFAAGKKVYNGGSNSANRGMTLDPSGYMERSRMQRASRTRMSGAGSALPGASAPASSGGGGSSAGLASSAINQGDALAGGTTAGSQTVSNPDVGGLARMNLASQRQQGPAQFGSMINPNLSQVRSFDTALPDLPTAAPDLKMPGVPTNPAGQLKSKLDADFRMKQEQGYDSLSATIAQLQNALAKMGQEYNVELREGKSAATKGAADLAARYASMGGGPGTAYGQDYQEQTLNYGNFLNDLKTAFSQGKQDILNDQTAAQTSFQTLIRGLLGMQGERDAKEKAAAALAAKTAAAAKAAAAKRAAALKAASSRSYSSYSGGSSYRPPSYSSSSSSRSTTSSAKKRTPARTAPYYGPAWQAAGGRAMSGGTTR